ncbi:MAG: universal stress protein [Thermodesulfobacteriota bacterium]
MWGKVLLASNGVEQDRLAIEEAVAIAKRFGSSLDISAVVDVNEEFETTAPGLTDKLKAKMKKAVDELVAQAAKADIKASVSVSVGESHVRFSEKVKELGAELVVMGTRGRTGLKKIFMGSLTANVIGHVRCSVLVAKGEPRRGEYKSLLVPTDGSESSSHAIHMACRLAKELGSKITILNVVPVYGDQVDLATKTGLSEVFAVESKAIMTKAERIATEYGLSVTDIVVDEGYPADEIVRVAKEGRSDLIVIGSHGSAGITHAVMGSTAQQVIEQAPCPILVVKQ